jgi:hypothetical protein
VIFASTANTKRGTTGDPHLDRFTRSLDDAAVQYWVEAGTLLSLVREGRLFPNDKDADIGIWSDELDRFGPVVEDMKAQGCRVVRETHHGRPFKFKIHPEKPEAGRVLDIQIYRRHKDVAWSPVYTVANIDYRWHRPDRVVRGAVRWPLRMMLAHKVRDVEVTQLPWRWMGWMGTWVFPLGLLEQTSRNNPFNLRFPEPVEDYLEYRYGDWRTPQSGWVYWEHDGSYRRGPPEDHLE